MSTDGPRSTSSRRSPARSLLFVGIAALLLGVFLPLLMEGLIRVVRPQAKSWLDIHAVHPGGLPFHHHQANVRQWLDVGEVSYHVVTDTRGHRIARTPVPAPAGARSVWFVGDSFTFGQGSSFEDGFVGKVAEAGYRVDNGGVNGWGPAQYLADFEYNLRASAPPDAVVLGTYLGNDYFDMIWSKEPVIHDGILGNPGDLKSKVKRASHLYRLLSNVYHKYFPGTREYGAIIDQMAREQDWRAPDLRRAEELYRAAILAFARRCESLRVPLLVLVIPTKEAVASLRHRPLPIGGRGNGGG